MAVPVFSLRSAVDQIAKCDFECVAGHLKNNVGWQWLEKRAATGPLFAMGQAVFYLLKADVDGVRLERWVSYTVVGCTMSSDANGRTWLYSISRDPPDAWHAGGKVTHNVRESELQLEEPRHDR